MTNNVENRNHTPTTTIQEEDEVFSNLTRIFEAQVTDQQGPAQPGIPLVTNNQVVVASRIVEGQEILGIREFASEPYEGRPTAPPLGYKIKTAFKEHPIKSVLTTLLFIIGLTMLISSIASHAIPAIFIVISLNILLVGIGLAKTCFGAYYNLEPFPIPTDNQFLSHPPEINEEQPLTDDTQLPPEITGRPSLPNDTQLPSPPPENTDRQQLTDDTPPPSIDSEREPLLNRRRRPDSIPFYYDRPAILESGAQNLFTEIPL